METDERRGDILQPFDLDERGGLELRAARGPVGGGDAGHDLR